MLSKIVARVAKPAQSVRFFTAQHDCPFPYEKWGFQHKEVARVAAKAPDFKAQAWYQGKFQEVSLDQYKGKWVVLFFYPLDFTFVCPTEIVAFSEAAEEFRKNNCEVIACSIDSQFSHMEWTKKPRE